MTGPSSPEHLEELMTGYALDSLSPEEEEEFKRLLAENPQLATEVNLCQEALDLLPYNLPEVEPPSHLHWAILKAARAEVPAESSRTRRVRRWSRLPWSTIAGSIAALLALAVGLDNYRLRQELKTASLANDRLRQEIETAKPIITALQQPNTRILALVGTKDAKTASGSILLNTEAQKALIAVQNLPTPPADKVYRLWAIRDNKPIACGEFSATQQGLDAFSLRDAACSSTQSTFAVSLEPTSLPPQPAGPIVMTEQKS
jgi:anti-sigma-K factor RskA